jgi:hypothetical protein
MFDAYANFEYGATGNAAGFTLPWLQFWAKTGKLAITNDPINVNDIANGYNVIAAGGTLGETDWTPPANVAK